MEIETYLKERFQIAFDDQQRAALEPFRGVTLLLAAPGAGKTTVTVTRLAKLIAAGAAAGSVLALTFNREAARDMASRYRFLFSPLSLPEPRFYTIHSFCYEILRLFSKRSGRPAPGLIDDQKQRRTELVRGLYAELFGEFADDDALDELLRLITYYKNSLLPPSSESGPHSAELPRLLEAYERLKKARRLMDFDDMMPMALKALSCDPGLLRHLRGRFLHLSLDEAQDASPIQHRVLEQFVETCESVFFVGDEDQSIYAFRGASPSYLTAINRVYPGARVLKMEQSFRLGDEVCLSAARVISKNKNRYEKRPKPAFTGQEKVSYPLFPDAKAQNEYLAKKLSALSEGATAAVLYRNNPSAVGLLDALTQAGVEFYIREHQTAFSRLGAVKDVMTVIALSQKPWDAELFGRVYYKLGAYISKAMFSFAKERAREGDNIFELLTQFGDENKNSSLLRYFQSRLAAFPRMRPHKVIDCILSDLGYRDFLSRRSKSGYRMEGDLQKLSVLRQIAFGCGTIDELREKLGRLDALIEAHAGQKGAPVTLSTIHSAKGMEFDEVYVIDLAEGVFPSSRAIDGAKSGESDAMEEETRLMYVAMTRAKKRLELICAGSDGESPAPSRFLWTARGENSGTGPLGGKRVVHRYFGEGKILSVDPAQRTCRIRFGKLGVKILTLDVFSDESIIRVMEEA